MERRDEHDHLYIQSKREHRENEKKKKRNKKGEAEDFGEFLFVVVGFEGIGRGTCRRYDKENMKSKTSEYMEPETVTSFSFSMRSSAAVFFFTLEPFTVSHPSSSAFSSTAPPLVAPLP